MRTRIGLYGLGKSNLAVLRKVSQRIEEFTLVLRSDADEAIPGGLPENATEILCRFGKEAREKIDEEVLFLSPSVKRSRPAFSEAAARGVILSSDAEIFFFGLRAPHFSLPPFSGRTLAVTGSDGKSTTTALAAALTGGIPCGNFGIPFSDVPDDGRIAVAELSSFQLDPMKPAPLRAALTSLSENHLDFHGTADAYVSAKKNLFRNAAEAVYPADDEFLSFYQLRAPFCLFSERLSDEEIRARYETLHTLTLDGETVLFDGAPHLSLAGAKMRGTLARKNQLCALALTLGMTEKRDTGAILRDFSGLPHRCARVYETGGVGFFDSSIDSTPARTAATLSDFSSPPVVILCGRSKGVSYEGLVPVLLSKTRGAVLFGEIGTILSPLLRKHPDYPAIFARSMTDAVKAAFRLSGGRADVLLSPSGTSFDLYKNYSARGEDFLRAAKALIPPSEQK